ncbi:VRR-NUC domain-containing protein [Ileibacterium valens]|uniref:VRR-NUC domain-containing protein n=1 Tax=Ileibacterium valens TaxID=1862668 RepID=UPI0023576CE8|nr:VRR-NUC domain-containing protein [Ileibacterium valens]
MKEKQIEQKLVKSIKQAGGLALKFVSPGNAGVPDRLLLMPNGIAAFAELKAPGMKPRALQQIQINRIRKLGFKVFVIDDPEQIPDVVSEVMADAAYPA